MTESGSGVRRPDRGGGSGVKINDRMAIRVFQADYILQHVF
jgi:hypothetical protein